MKNEIICKFIGPRIDLRHSIEKYGVNSCMPFQIGENDYIDLIEPYICFNHSCRPNSGVRSGGILFALEDISLGQEIFYDYSTTADDVTWEMECLCGTKECRKKIGDFLSIPHLQREFYLDKNAITAHIKNTFY